MSARRRVPLVWQNRWRGCITADWRDYRLSVVRRGADGWAWKVFRDNHRVADGYAESPGAARQAALDAARDAATADLADSAMDTVRRLVGYASHRDWCGKLHGADCSCGLAELLTATSAAG